MLEECGLISQQHFSHDKNNKEATKKKKRGKKGKTASKKYATNNAS